MSDGAMTGVMNSLGQDGNFKSGQMPIKNRVNALDVSILFLILINFLL